MTRGINYGHQFSAATYNVDQVQSDLRLLRKAGFTALRVAYPPFDQPTAVVRCQAIVKRALDSGFTVIWGVGAGGTTLNPARWLLFKQYIKNTFLPWIESIKDQRLIASLGNEEDFHNEDATLSKNVIRYDIAHDLALAAKNILSKSTCDYVTDAGQRAAWLSDGLGYLDRIGFNLYYEWLPAGTFAAATRQISSQFNNKAYVAEWNTEAGYDSALILNASYAESLWQENIRSRRDLLESVGLDHFFFTYQDGSFGLPVNKWSMRKNDGTMRQAWWGCAQLRSKQVRSSQTARAINARATTMRSVILT